MPADPMRAPFAPRAAAGGDVIGREDELDALRAFVARVDEGPSALVLEGPPGAGKTTLWRAGVDAARDRGHTILRTRPAEAEAKLAFTGLADLVEHVADEALQVLPPPQRRALAVALLLEEAKGAAPDERGVQAAVLAVLRSLSARGPLAVAVDDVQWLDAPSAAALSFAFRRLGREPVGILLSLRTEGARASPLDLDASLDPARVTRLPVGPLTLGAVHQLLRTRLGLVLPRPTLRRVHDAAGGNPFFALELGRALQRRGGRVEPGAPLPVPDDVRELVRDRLADLPGPTIEALLAASALSQPTIELIDEARSALGPAFAAHVVELEGDVVRFTHPLLASVLYADASALRRRSLHRRLAGVVDDSEERARHLALAAEEPDETVARALERAAAAARARGATAAAADLSEQAVRLTSADRPDDIGRRTVAAAGYRFLAGETARARDLLEESLGSDAGQAAGAEALVLLARVHRWEGDQVHALALSRRALAVPGASDAVRADAAQSLAATLFFLREDLEEALRAADLAVELGVRAGVAELHLEALLTKAQLEAGLGRAEATETLAAADALGDEATVQMTAASPPWYRGYFLIWSDRATEAAAIMRATADEAAARGDESSISIVLASLAQAEYLAGGWQDAERIADDAYEAALQTGQRPQQALAVSTRAVVRASLGAEADARADAEAALALAGERTMGVARIHALWALGLLELSLDRPAEVVATLAPRRARLLAAGVREPGMIRFVPDEIEALLALDRADEAEPLLAWLEECGRALDRASALGAAARCRGLLAATRGELDVATSHFERALGEHERAGIPFERARTLLALGSAQRRAKRIRAARETLAGALAAFERLGARVWAEHARGELARIGGRAPSGGELTPTEERVAALVSQGKTNREVAAALVVSERTVEFHLSNAYRKLGVRSRAELARRLAGAKPR